MPEARRKALIFCDKFFPPEVFERETEDLSFWKTVEKRYVELAWPDTCFEATDKLAEFVSYPQESLLWARDADIIVSQMGAVDERLIETASRSLKVIACLRSGPVNIDVECATRYGVPVLFVPDRSGPAVAEYTLGAMIAARRFLVAEHVELLEGRWNQFRHFHYHVSPPLLSEQVVGLVGFGNIARLLARMLTVFQSPILACDPGVSGDFIRSCGVEKVSLDRLLAKSDIVSLHVRLTPDTTNMIGKRELSLMKPKAIFINTARGGLVDEQALYAALNERQIAGAVLDTFREEPWRKKNPLANLDNVILTPHIAGASRVTVETGARSAARYIADFFAGRPVTEHCINPEYQFMNNA